MRIQNKDLSKAIRVLSMDAVEKANSGHPGMPMGMADVATVLFKNFLKFNSSNPSWINRDRFVLSAGHGSMLLYSLLYLTGYKSISISDIKNFRQLNSICAGHPEYEKNSGIETTTGPLGQGIANAVGFAIAEEVLKKKLGSKIINHKTYVLAGDGCLMEGISHEAMSLAGHLKLKNLIMLFDNNSISIDGPTSLAVSDNYKKRFESYGWNYIDIDGHNEKQIFSAINKAQKAIKPTVISCKTQIGFGSPNKSGKASSHGSPLGPKEIELVRKKLNWPFKPFEIPKNILKEWRKIGLKGYKTEAKWKKNFSRNKNRLKKLFNNNFSHSIIKQKKDVIANLKPLATRKSSEAVLNSLFKLKNNLIGGSADLAGSNNTKSKFNKVINAKNFDGDYIHYGVREHAMCGIMNGLALHSNLIPYGGTFLIFSDYCRPADQTETIECWDLALKNSKTPSVLALTRQNLDPIRKRFTSKNKCSYGAYEVMRTNKKIKITILATGSEVNLALNISHKLAKEKIYSKVISMPCQEIFDKQSQKYKSKILNETSKIFSIEAGSDQSWSKYINNKGLAFSINDFGKSAPYIKVYDHFGLNVGKICKKIKLNIRKNAN